MIVNGMEVIDRCWFSSLADGIGIVVVEDVKTKKRKAYIGTTGGFDEDSDIKKIATWGGKVLPCTLEKILALLNNGEIKC